VCGGEAWEAELPAIGPHIALDAAAAILTAVEAGVSVSSAAAGLKSAVLPPMRMEIRQLGGATILLDNYNASPPSMVSAIETLAELPVAGRRFAVIGEMRELGEYSEEAHRLIGIALRENPPDRVMFVGDATRFAQEELGSGSMGAGLEDVRTFLRELCPGDAALVKGSRALKLERALEGA
jgi:UDP-N-acetylmuramoyl-tripeptide--D-alanyl-D-alanine ligase